MSDSKTITIKKDDLWRYSTFILIAIVLIGGVLMFTGNGNTNTGTNDPDTQPSVVSASIDDDAVLGDANAPITIIEFTDYECPFCGRHYSDTLPQIKSQYIDEGIVKYVVRDFPLTSIHPNAQKAGEAVECVRDQGGDEAYFEMHDLIFENQNLGVGRTNLEAWASELGYDISSCLDSGEFASEVQKDSSDAQAAGIRGTPGFVIMKSGENEGTLLAGAYPFSAFQQIIEAELA